MIYTNNILVSTYNFSHIVMNVLKLISKPSKSRQHEEQNESPTLPKTRQRSSKAKTDRNKRRLEAFVDKKSIPSTTENGEHAQECLEHVNQ